MLEHYRQGYRATRHPVGPTFKRYTVFDLLAELFGELQGLIERGLDRLFT
jgi:hypothetical protein